MILIPLALAAAGAVGLAAGTHLQHRAVRSRSEGPSQPRERGRDAVLRAFGDPAWLLGTGVIVLATVLNIVALGLAPIALVQPVGVLALICAAVISARALGVRMNRGLVRGIAMTGLSVVAFVGVSSAFVRDTTAAEPEALRLVWALLALIALGAVAARKRAGHLARVVGAGVLFGAVAASAHVVSAAALGILSAPEGIASAVAHSAIPLPLLGLLLLLLAAASALGAWLVQTAYASGPPETVLAGLTVIDPVIAVAVGAALLGEYAPMPPVALLLLAVSGLVACCGVAGIIRNHPDGPGTNRTAVAPVIPPTRDRALDGAAIANRRS